MNTILLLNVIYWQINKKNAKELEKLQREYIEYLEKFKEKHAAAYQTYSDEIEKTKKVGNDIHDYTALR